MKHILMIVLLASVSIVAAEKEKSNKADGVLSVAIDGAKLYKKRCAICHGENGTKSPKSGVGAIAGMDATRLALLIRAYRDQDEDVGAFTMHKSSQIMKDSTINLSSEHIIALAKYISGLK